ncbi:putative E3 ubiquitin-protein ligase RF298 isoform X2 [Coffea eugenioides]|uniref:E3 ubiquitin-protein ligase RF298 isoform X2 n=1 Tax=Coffea arabica TaxID=13443 RepID=A0ABM4X8K2_COFAR|nr:putative E3 ubiquitin-protein ligase RF298 isoform X2 [Coffea arabica]XP_027165560.1 putative E3 ubiquitin-protein ligase RF298 isoform X2 [Coffea eugenioides]
MASTVLKACSGASSESSLMIVQEKGSRNKRKFRADTPMAEPNKVVPEPQSECKIYEFTAEKFDSVQSHAPSNGCETCCVKQDQSEGLKLDLRLSCLAGPSEVGSSLHREEVEAYESDHNAQWNDLTESELQELVLSNLESNLKTAIKKIVAYGYSEKVATDAVSRSGQCFGTKDTVSNIVDSTLAYLRGGRHVDTLREYDFDNLMALEHYMLAESVCFLREVKPDFSTGDAMWFLLVSDMNISHACTMEGDHPNNIVSDLASLSLTSDADASVSCSHNGPSEATNMANPYGHTFHSEAATVAGVSSLKSKGSLVAHGLAPDKERPSSPAAAVEKTFSLAGTSVSEEKFVGSRKASGFTRRDYILRQKSLHLDKSSRTYGSKVSSRTGKLSGFGGLVLDKKLRPIAESTGVNSRNIFKIGKAVGVEMPQDNLNHNISANVGFPSDTELSLSLPAKSSCGPMAADAEISNSSYRVVPVDESLPHSVPEEKRDEMILKLVPRVRELQNQLQEWTEWANQKVMQAARRLSKDKAELKALRQEKDEVERLKKEKQNLEENTMKKLLEMENALCKASSQVERANATVRKLEVENAALRQEMEVAKSRAAETAANCEEVYRREKANMLKFQSREKQKGMIQEELAAEKSKYMQLKQKLEQAEDLRAQLEDRWRQEAKRKEELLAQASLLKKEREKIEVSLKTKEDSMKSKAENNLHKHKDDIQKLEKEISKLRLMTDSSKIAALKRGIDGNYASRLTDSTYAPMPKESHISYISKVVNDFQDYSGGGDVKRERECVMCLSEEMSVVFLPCAHQVVCRTCNELHEKQGMEDCPSCRSPIQQRICVRYACA